MKNEKHPNIAYESFNTYVFRTPFFPFQKLLHKLDILETDENSWVDFLSDSHLQEAIFIGSPILYDEIQKFLSGYLVLKKDVYRLKMSVLRYFTRMSSRCTPFGLFAGISLGKLSDETNIVLAPTKEYKRTTRLDMNFLCNFAQEISKLPNIRESINFYSNTSVYQIKERLRYIEYYYQNNRRIHNISAVDYSEDLAKILAYAKSGTSIQELANILVDNEISLTEAVNFIHELIDSQLLVSELEPSVTGKDFLNQLYETLKTTPVDESIINGIAVIIELLKNIDTTVIGSSISFYKDIKQQISKLELPYESKYIFQTDMLKPTYVDKLDYKVIQDIHEALVILNKITIPQTETLLSKFIQNFKERYEEKEMPLLHVLDTDIGIGYLENTGETNPLLENLVLPSRQPLNADRTWNHILSILHRKLIEAIRSNTGSIELTDSDFDFLEANWNDLPLTFSSICQFFSIKDNSPLIYIRAAGGSSAANMHGRFCHLNKDIENFVIDITQYEQTENDDSILAEIVHLPESRTGNILLRPILRPFEIPYLSKSSVDVEYQLPLTDLYISIKGTQIILKSKRLNKQIIPRLSTSHNYSYNSMPIYHFLCDLQTQGQRKGISFSWGSIANDYEFLPRVTYKHTILSLAKWAVKTSELKLILEKNEKEEILENIRNWRNEKKMPRYVIYPNGDNELFVNLENTLSIEMLYSIVKGQFSFILEEFPIDIEYPIIKDKDGNIYTNEFVFGFYKKTIK